MCSTDTKSGRPDHRPVPTFLTGHIECYLNVYRPILLRYSVRDWTWDVIPATDQFPRRIHNQAFTDHLTALWISRFRGPLTYGAVERAITETTRLTLGVPVNPHLFRAADATSAALHAPQSPHFASALLQHSNRGITEEHYIRASSLSVARDFAALIGDLRTP